MKNYLDMPTVGYWSDFGGVEVKEIVYDVEDYMKVTTSMSSHRLKIYYSNNGDAYIRLNGRRLKLSDCMYVFQIVYHKKEKIYV